jgi:hypothetical protein
MRNIVMRIVVVNLEHAEIETLPRLESKKKTNCIVTNKLQHAKIALYFLLEMFKFKDLS